ncbi:O-antigen ligase family protein [Curvibacter sp. CHRR-16]|uniref:O-antigen ligase family protein n=1 Tax=Curvibacter sp. CHRR-16 TaxID=2835872 RepID=UPI001BDB44BF|nr:O-antigen ligase family protein [Curvibacter sp. CHRR-16]MBT0571531.1 O-antigen ligase family protein [Curvibacter sp. CHRR-16]
MLIATFVFYFANKYAPELGLNRQVLPVRVRAWYMITSAAFLAHNFWLFVLLTAYVLWRARKKDENPLALAACVLFAVPLFSEQIPGFGLVNYFFDLNYFRLMVLVVFVPMAYAAYKESTPLKSTAVVWIDRFLLLYVLYATVPLFGETTFTGAIRMLFMVCVDIVIPYYVFSRCLRDRSQIEDVLKMILLGLVVLGLIGFFEYAKHWLLYSRVSYALGVDAWGYGGYLRREDSLRALASTGQPIVLGFLMAVAFILQFYIAESIKNTKIQMVVLGLFLLGLYAPVSRGPWVGCFAGLLAFFFLSENFRKYALKKLPFVVLAIFVLLLTPIGQKLLDKLPLIGSVDPMSVTYREDLLKNALPVIQRSLWFGSNDYMEADDLQVLRANGIIDIVNSYVAVTLSGGLIGLCLFVGYFVVVLVDLAKVVFSRNNAYSSLAANLMAIFFCIMVTIYTVSSITFIPVMYWVLGGLAAATIAQATKARILTS